MEWGDLAKQAETASSQWGSVLTTLSGTVGQVKTIFAAQGGTMTTQPVIVAAGAPQASALPQTPGILDRLSAYMGVSAGVALGIVIGGPLLLLLLLVWLAKRK